MKQCSIEKCSNEANGARGWCRKHYRRWQRNGDPEKTTHPERGHIYSPPAPPEERFWNQVDKNGPIPTFRPDFDPCWIWIGLKREGYGRFYPVRTTPVAAHRFSYELLKEPIPSDEEAGYRVVIDHLCRVTSCVNPNHLEVVSHQENVLRGIGFAAVYAARTHCINGHEFTEENTSRSKTRARRCLTCHRENTRHRRAMTKLECG